jgi:HK97 family phage major capsid protein
MEKLKIRLLKAWECEGTNYDIGALLEIDEVTGKSLIEDKTAELYDPEAEEAERVRVETAQKAEQDRIQELVRKELDAVSKGLPKSRPQLIIGRDRSDDDPRWGWKSFSEFAMGIRDAAMPGARVDARLQKSTGLEESTPALGGFLVPPEYRNELLQRTYDQALVAGRCRSIPIGSDIVRIPTINETSRLDGGRAGGILAYWKDEGELKVPTKPAFGQVELRLKKLIGLCYATDELLQDSAISLDALLGDLFAQEIGFKIDDAIINGTGVGMPLGLLAAPATVTVAKEAAQPAATLLAQNIIKMWARMWSRSRSNAVWFINQDIEPQLYTMSLAVGTGGLPVYLPPNGLSGAPFGTLYGRPVLPIEQCSTLGTVGDIILADMSQYILATRGGIQAATSIHVNFVYDETAFRFVIRVDGQPWWNSPLTPYKGGAANSTSPFVVLATRA